MVAIDVAPRIIEKLRQRVELQGAGNIEARLADVHLLPFPDGSFEAIYMITVIGEIPTPTKAMHEFHRVLKGGGTLAFSEFLPDPDYPLPSTLNALAIEAGFRLKSRLGKLFYYTMIFN
ncbi:MAG: class I SAM-dependent methyltransferase [Anaerolineales bacterium]|nr:class I SAM-dependent methyltransferase [Anaerolineales bacterium]